MLAEGVGFEPTLRFPVNTLSKRAPSATRPPLHASIVHGDGRIFLQAKMHDALCGAFTLAAVPWWRWMRYAPHPFAAAGTAPNNPLPERLGRANARYHYVYLCFIFLILTIYEINAQYTQNIRAPGSLKAVAASARPFGNRDDG